MADRALEKGWQRAAAVARRKTIVRLHLAYLALRELLPREIWSSRHVFFYPGMRMEIGSCHRRFPTPPFFTREHSEFGQDRKYMIKHVIYGYFTVDRGTPPGGD